MLRSSCIRCFVLPLLPREAIIAGLRRWRIRGSRNRTGFRPSDRTAAMSPAFARSPSATYASATTDAFDLMIPTSYSAIQSGLVRNQSSPRSKKVNSATARKITRQYSRLLPNSSEVKLRKSSKSTLLLVLSLPKSVKACVSALSSCDIFVSRRIGLVSLCALRGLASLSSPEPSDWKEKRRLQSWW